MRSTSYEELAERDRQLVNAAKDALLNAYAPYSGFAVGSAVRTLAGEIFASSNLENSSYGLTICAEAGALAAVNTAGKMADVEAIAIVGFQFYPANAASQVVTPCGRCRQLITEAAQLSKRDIQVFACSGDLKHIEISTISELLPYAFGSETVLKSNPTNPGNKTARLKALKA